VSFRQPSLLGLEAAPLALGDLAGAIERVELTAGAWLEVRRGWLSGADGLGERLWALVPWRQERRRMYDRTVAVPRVVCFYERGQALPDPAFEAMRDALSAHYAAVLGEPFETVGLCGYRDGRDSVAWHGDTIGRAASEDTVVAIVSLGATRRFALRPRGGGSGIALDLASGDLVAMGGSCQRTWEHAVPKTARAVGARISLQFRVAGVR
jgi:alkylated DNA repair dioxygenase AlkB